MRFCCCVRQKVAEATAVQSGASGVCCIVFDDGLACSAGVNSWRRYLFLPVGQVGENNS